MQDLRLIGVHEDGLHLILADDDGNRYRVPLDEPLRAAVRRDRPRLGQLQIELDGGLRPKDVQAMIRRGLTAEETAERAGWTVEKVRRYEGPVLAEREHVASLGRQVRLRSPGGRPGSTMLGTRVDERLRSRQIDAGTARWDSRRDADGRWTVVVFFNAGGRQRQAEWSFDLLARSLQACDDEARWLSADEDATPAGPIPAPHLQAARATHVYDVEAEGGVAAPGHLRGGESIDLMAAMRERSSRRARRRRPSATDAPGIDRAPEDALPLTPLVIPVEDAGSPPAAHPHPRDDSDASAAQPGPTPPDESTPVGTVQPRLPAPDGSTSVGPARPGPTAPDESASVATPSGADARSGAVATPEDGVGDPPATEHAQGDPPATDIDPTGPVDDASADLGAADSAAEQHETTPRPQPRRPKQPSRRPAARKSGRPSVPSWDDIMFGKKPD